MANIVIYSIMWCIHLALREWKLSSNILVSSLSYNNASFNDYSKIVEKNNSKSPIRLILIKLLKTFVWYFFRDFLLEILLYVKKGRRKKTLWRTDSKRRFHVIYLFNQKSILMSETLFKKLVRKDYTVHVCIYFCRWPLKSHSERYLEWRR